MCPEPHILPRQDCGRWRYLSDDVSISKRLTFLMLLLCP